MINFFLNARVWWDDGEAKCIQKQYLHSFVSFQLHFNLFVLGHRNIERSGQG